MSMDDERRSADEHADEPLREEDIARDEQDAVRAAGETTLARVKELLDEAIRKRREEESS